MASKTTNYNLHKIDLNDAPPDITVLNQNWDTIDAELKGRATLVGGKVPEEQLPQMSAVEGVTVALPSTWTEQVDGSFATSVTVVGVTSDCQVVVDCNLTGTDIDADIEVMTAWGCVNRASQSTNTLTFYCYGETPTISIPINVVVMG